MIVGHEVLIEAIKIALSEKQRKYWKLFENREAMLLRILWDELNENVGDGSMIEFDKHSMVEVRRVLNEMDNNLFNYRVLLDKLLGMPFFKLTDYEIKHLLMCTNDQGIEMLRINIWREDSGMNAMEESMIEGELEGLSGDERKNKMYELELFRNMRKNIIMWLGEK